MISPDCSPRHQMETVAETMLSKDLIESPFHHVSELIPGKNPLHMTPENITDYCCGSFELVERDLGIVMKESPAIMNAMPSLEDILKSAFHFREELINLKKIVYHIHHVGTSIERSLAQLATYFRSDHDVYKMTKGESAKPYLHSDRFTTIVDARMQCKGACHAAADSRAVAKLICCLPRHPAKNRPLKLQRLPQSLETFGLLQEAVDTLNSDMDCVEKVTLDMTPVAYVETWKQKVQTILSNLEAEGSLSHHDTSFTCLILVCRGADKALRMIDEVNVAKSSIEGICSHTKRILSEIKKREIGLDDIIMGLKSILESPLLDNKKREEVSQQLSQQIRKKILYHRHLNMLSGYLPQLTAFVSWLEELSTAVESSGRGVIFLGGDSNAERQTLPAALLFPKGEVDIMGLYSMYRTVEAKFRPKMFLAIRENGWPDSLQHCLGSSSKPGDKIPDNKYCKVCEKVYSCLWVHRGVCCECEDRIRHTNKRCPYRAQCSSSWFCPHSLRCVICDAHSCEKCRLMRGDAGVVIAVAKSIQPCRVALDFDRTLASTKNGARPEIGRHVVDVDLVSLMWKYKCTVVTRNQNADAIKQFLVDQGAPSDIDICTVGKKVSKVNSILGLDQKENGENKDALLFVDDSIQELVDPLVSAESRIWRILFVRSLA